MAKKKQEKVTVNKTQVLVFRAEKPLMKDEWELLVGMVDRQMKGQDIPYVVVPFSADITVAESNIDCMELIDEKAKAEADKQKKDDKQTPEGGEKNGDNTPGQNEEGTENK